MKICQFCGNRIGENDKACPVCHRPVQEDFNIPERPQNRPMWKWLMIACFAFAAAFAVSGVLELVVDQCITTKAITDLAFTFLCGGVGGLFLFFYKKSV